jgi:hypothetical protein
MPRRSLARPYYFVRRSLVRAEKLAGALFTGAWLGVLGRDTLNEIDDLYYMGGESRRFSPIDYQDDDYHRLGLWSWEQSSIERYFRTPGSVAVLGAGGGREVLALRRLGFDADGWECQPSFVRTANRILEQAGFPQTVWEAPRDTVPPGEKTYAGAIVGWGVYTMIQGRERRVALLRALRARVRSGSPLLLSFFPRREHESRFAVTAATANLARRLLGREKVELGDYLEPNYVHYFSEPELRSELKAAGFTLDLFQPHPYGHAVALAEG